jgi:predicted NUDIX family NTP pyrophosphohydrolase
VDAKAPARSRGNSQAQMPMTRKISAGILLYRVQDHAVEVFLVHPGGPYWARKDDGAWSIPKGETEDGADLLATAYAEFHEETGSPLQGQPVPLAPLKQAGGKVVHAWAVQGDIDAASIRSNIFAIEWPPRSGKTREFPEVDRAGWFDLPTARLKLLAGQRGFLDQLQAHFLQKPPTAKSDGVR